MESPKPNNAKSMIDESNVHHEKGDVGLEEAGNGKKATWLNTCLRESLVDFHNGLVCRNLTENFNAKKYVDILVKSNVNRHIAFTKCNRGYYYYPTKKGTAHPYLRGDMFGEIASECTQRGIAVMAYYNVTRDEIAFNENPDWQQKFRDGSPYHEDSFPAHLKHVCINSPYVQERLWPSIDEIMNTYTMIRGFFFDATVFMPGTCFCEYCRKKMEFEKVDMDNAEERLQFRVRSLRAFINSTTERIREKIPDAAVYYNDMNFIGKPGMFEGQTHLVIEAMPSAWGYEKTPFYGRYYRNKGIHFCYMTGRFHKQWSDFGGIKSRIAQLYDAGVALSLGASLSAGDQANSDGTLDEAAYEIVGAGFDYYQSCEEWIADAKSLPYVAILCRSYQDSFEALKSDSSNYGISTALIEESVVFDVIDMDEDLSQYKAIVLEDVPVGIDAAKKLSRYVEEGGRLLNLGGTIFTGAGKSIVEDVLGVTYTGLSPYSINYFRLPREALANRIHNTDWVTYGSAMHMVPTTARSLGQLVYPYTETKPHRIISHFQAPPGDAAPFPAVTMNRFGKGLACCVASPLGSLYHENAYPPLRILIKNILNAMICVGDRVLEAKVPLSVELTLTKQKERLIIHMLNFQTNRKMCNVEVIEEIPPVFDSEVSILLDKDPTHVYLAPERQQLTWKRDGKHIVITVPRFDIHTMVVLESE